MPNTRRGPIPDDLGWLIDTIDDYADRLRTLEAPSGEALSNTVATLKTLVSNIQAQLDAYIAGRYTNAQIDALIDAKVSAAIAAVLAGTVTIGGGLTVTGGVSVGNDIAIGGGASVGGGITVAGTVTVPGARATNLGSAPSRVTGWIAGDGRLGYT